MNFRDIHEPASPIKLALLATLIPGALSTMRADDAETISVDTLFRFCKEASKNPKQFAEFFPDLFPNHDSSKSSSNAHHQAKLSKTGKGRRNWLWPFG